MESIFCNIIIGCSHFGRLKNEYLLVKTSVHFNILPIVSLESVFKIV